MEAGSFTWSSRSSEVMRMDRRLWSLLLCIHQVWSQLCTEPCRCPPTVPRCPVGVPLVFDSCGCCQLCARQEGEACSARLPCDAHRGLQCDYSASFPEGAGQCIAQNELGCEVNGRRLEEGQVFRPSCARLCRCLGGGVTCVPLCSDDLQGLSDKCLNPQLVQLPGRCCKEWVCEGLDNSISTKPAFPASHGYGGWLPNCITWTSAWSPCSHSCGPGVSTRTTNKNWACRLQTEARLCQVRPCQTRLQGLRPRSVLCDSSHSSPVAIQLEHRGCRSTRAYRPRFCAETCGDTRCCSPSHTRTVRMHFRCPRGRPTHQQVMMIESCSCSISNCHQPRSVPHWL